MNSDSPELQDADLLPHDWVRDQLPKNSELLRLDEDLYDEDSLFDEENEHDALIYFANKTESSLKPTSNKTWPPTDWHKGTKQYRPTTARHGTEEVSTNDKWIGYRKWYWTLLSIIESTDSSYDQKMTALFEMILFLQTGWRKTCPVSQRLLPTFQIQQCKLKYARYLDGNIEEKDEIVRDGVNMLRSALENVSISQELNNKQGKSTFCAALEEFSIEECLHFCDPGLLKEARLPWDSLLVRLTFRFGKKGCGGLLRI
eukprot:gb/GECG01010171.1/.p1 GENE.gb/GECG01010171.1/~~gb/GECG01010171.1/.p1  ORF type:complete len:258 (+),score=31.79 gb/GECG01010171.1/:1-774(+)